MLRSGSVDGFRLSYDDHPGGGGTVVLLHGWPGDRHDYRDVVPRLADRCRVIVPDLRGFGGSTAERPADPAQQDPAQQDPAQQDPAQQDPAQQDPAQHGADGQARSVVGLIEELDAGPAVVAGYDVGSRVAQAVARARPDLVRALVLSPPLPGAGDRVLTPDGQREFWYQAFHRLPLVEQLLDGSRGAVRNYLAHFWSHWSGPRFVVDDAELDRLADAYARPGAFVASVNWYRAGSGMVAVSTQERPPPTVDRIAVRTTVLWPEHDPLFPRAWSDRVGDWFAHAEVRPLDGVGHFTPLEAPDAVAAAILERAA